MKISDLYVLFSAKGVESVTEATKKVQSGLEAANKVITSIGTAATASFGAASASVLALATAGVAASSTGQLLQFQLERLSRTVAGLFGPEINKLIELIVKVTDWIDRLSNSQKKMLAFFVLLAAGIAAFLVFLPLIIGGIQGIVGAIIELGTAIAALEVETGIGALLPLIGIAIAAVTAAITAAVAAIGSFLVFTDEGNEILSELADTIMPLVNDAWELFADLMGVVATIAKAVLLPVLKGIVIVLREIVTWLRQGIEQFRLFTGISKQISKPDENRGALAPRVGGFESVAGTWERIAQESRLVGAGKPIEEQQLEQQQTTAKNTGGILEEMRRRIGLVVN